MGVPREVLELFADHFITLYSNPGKSNQGTRGLRTVFFSTVAMISLELLRKSFSSNCFLVEVI